MMSRPGGISLPDKDHRFRKIEGEYHRLPALIADLGTMTAGFGIVASRVGQSHASAVSPFAEYRSAGP